MFPLEKAFWKLLNHNITYNGSTIPLIRKLRQADKTPCIQIKQADEYLVRKDYVEINKVQYLRRKYNCSIWIQVFANNENERTAILNGIDERITQAEINHYTTCRYYNPVNQNCENIGAKCEALTSENGRAIKNQCPNPKQNNYSSFFKTNNIIKNTFKEEGKPNLDDLQKNPPELRTTIKLSMDYYKYERIGGREYDSFEISGDLL